MSGGKTRTSVVREAVDELKASSLSKKTKDVLLRVVHDYLELKRKDKALDAAYDERWGVYDCPNCGYDLIPESVKGFNFEYCRRCGQKVRRG